MILVPAGAEAILATLGAQGYEAFCVGGCVRDSLLGNKPSDWDITTSATPDEILQVFAGDTAIPTGLAHGTVTVLIDTLPYEITTYRIDGDYSDSRRPDTVTFTDNLVADLARRDFTINAIAYHPAKGIIDPFHGQCDLQENCVRTVGDAAQRFTEDALRILRGIRFASTLDFIVEEQTKKAMILYAPNLQYIAVERIQVELTKTLLGTGVARVLQEFSSVIFQLIPELAAMKHRLPKKPYHRSSVWEHTLHSVSMAPEDEVIRLAMLFHNSGIPHANSTEEQGADHVLGHARQSAQIAGGVLKRLRYPTIVRERVVLLVTHHDVNIPATHVGVKRWLHHLGEDAFLQLLQVQKADAKAQNPIKVQSTLDHIFAIKSVYAEIKAQDECFTLAQLEVDGRALVLLGFSPGPQLGEVLNHLLGEVIADKLPNERAVLLEYAQTFL